MKLRCPKCGQDIRYDPAMAGRTVACPSCSARFRVRAARSGAKPTTTAAAERNIGPPGAQQDAERLICPPFLLSTSGLLLAGHWLLCFTDRRILVVKLKKGALAGVVGAVLGAALAPIAAGGGAVFADSLRAEEVANELEQRPVAKLLEGAPEWIEVKYSCDDVIAVDGSCIEIPDADFAAELHRGVNRPSDETPRLYLALLRVGELAPKLRRRLAKCKLRDERIDRATVCAVLGLLPLIGLPFAGWALYRGFCLRPKEPDEGLAPYISYRGSLMVVRVLGVLGAVSSLAAAALLL